MKIAIDLNDVIRDYTGQFKKYFIKTVNSGFDIDDEEIDNFDYSLTFPFNNREEYEQFNYIDCAFEIYGRAEACDKMLPYRFNDWIQNTLRDVEEDKIPEVMLVAPLEMALTIQSTYAFLAKIGCRVREIYFPIDSSSIWDRCDMLITANPKLLGEKPEGKISVKIEMPYNKDVDATYSYRNMMELIDDEEDKLIKEIEK